VQRRATRLIDECRGFEYCERLKETKLTTLETRAIRGDMIEVFKILNGWERVQENDFFRRDESGRRGHTQKLFKTRVRLDIANALSVLGYTSSGTTYWLMLYHSRV